MVSELLSVLQPSGLALRRTCPVSLEPRTHVHTGTRPKQLRSQWEDGDKEEGKKGSLWPPVAAPAVNLV